ncbi:MAG: type II/IV secretion system protein [Candidatus Calescibacterium sp.]|jgi:type II secretory ATPase GspE/PulE/Tfp pilus assembly ATPase PilB-like protein|nr:type II/IV secretion system protein [Candidatus Calescibacterium sp.]
MEIIISALEEDGIISRKKSEEIRRWVTERGKRVSEILIETGIFGDESFCEWMERKFGFQSVRSEDEIWESLVKLFPKSMLTNFMFIPVRYENEKLVVASPEPFDVPTNKISEISGSEVEVRVCSPRLVKKLISASFREGEEGGAEEFLSKIISEAINKNATDIHIIPSENECKIKFRIDGRLRDFQKISNLTFRLITNRIKVLSQLDISERRMPQDGRFSFEGYDIRVSVVPTIYGEKTALRILKKTFDFSLQNIGLNDSQIKLIKEAVNKQSGFIFVAGPTGSGKTTTIYSILLEIPRDEFNVFSIEDPVEYFVDGVNQIQINDAIGLTFSKVLRHVLRQDPDVIFVGELRDFESADIAIKSALTGHLVLTTVHAKDVASAILRFINLGVQPYILVSALSFGISQRLVRKICQNCGGKKCSVCKTGFLGRQAVFELIYFDEKLKSKIREKENWTEEELRDLFRKMGFSLLEDEIKKKVQEGITTEEEGKFVL